MRNMITGGMMGIMTTMDMAGWGVMICMRGTMGGMISLEVMVDMVEGMVEEEGTVQAIMATD